MDLIGQTMSHDEQAVLRTRLFVAVLASLRLSVPGTPC
jgi:hypothetical protein